MAEAIVPAPWVNLSPAVVAPRVGEPPPGTPASSLATTMSSPYRLFRYLFPFVLVLLAELVLDHTLRPYWVVAFLDKRSSTSAWGWLSPGWLALTWCYDLFLTFIASIVLALMLPREHRSAWIIGMGVTIGGLQLLTLHNYTSPDADFTMYGWIYGGYLMPVVGAALGATFVCQLERMRAACSPVSR